MIDETCPVSMVKYCWYSEMSPTKILPLYTMYAENSKHRNWNNWNMTHEIEPNNAVTMSSLKPVLASVFRMEVILLTSLFSSACARVIGVISTMSIKFAEVFSIFLRKERLEDPIGLRNARTVATAHGIHKRKNAKTVRLDASTTASAVIILIIMPGIVVNRCVDSS